MSYKERKESISKWFDEYVLRTFNTPERFGHLKEYHINKSDDFLRKRSIRERIDASTFLGDTEDILEMLKQALLDNREELIEYLADTDDFDNWEVFGSLPSNVTGHMYRNSMQHDWERGPIICKSFKIACQKKDSKLNNGFFIKTVYPV